MGSKRREFLKNTALGILGTGVATTGLNSNPLRNNTKYLSTFVECEPTTLDFYGEGPFYTEQPPLMNDNILAKPDEVGERLIITGRVLNLDCSEFIPNTIIDVWHADHDGSYDNDGYNLRGYTKSNEQGFYLFETILPGKYKNGSEFRPSHIHFKIKPPSFPLLITQLYFAGDDKIEGDAAASITSGNFNATNRIIELSKNADDKYEGQFDIVIDGSGLMVGTQDLHVNRGMIYSASPNPFDETVEIKYGVFQKAMVGILVFNESGQAVATLEQKEMNPEKYTVNWDVPAGLTSGYYFISIQINGLQVHYLKIFKK